MHGIYEIKKVPYHSKSGASGSITLSGSDKRIVVGSLRLDLYVGDQVISEFRKLNVDVEVTNRFSRTKISLVSENLSDRIRETSFKSIIPTGAFVKTFKIQSGDGKGWYTNNYSNFYIEINKYWRLNKIIFKKIEILD